MNEVSVFWQKRLIAVMVLVAVTLLNANGAPVFAQDEELKKRIEILEEKTRDIERMDEEEKGRWEELTGHVETLERELTMVDYRTGRIRALEEKVGALTIGGDLSIFLQGVLSNAEGLGKKADGSYSGDLFLIVPSGPYGNIYLRGDIGEGEGISPLLPPTFSGPNADLHVGESNKPEFELVEAWYWTSIPYPDIRDQRLELTLGKIDPAALFDANAVANSETSQFIADIFVNNLALEFGGAGLSAAYRFTSIYNKGLNVTGRVGLFEGDGDFKDVLDRPFLIAELDVWRPYYGLNGNYRLYGWQNNTSHTDLADESRDNLSNQGFGLSIDQQLSNDITLFARYGMQDKDVSPFDQVLTLGGQIVGNGWRRANDMIGIALGASHVSDKYQEASLTLDGYEADADYENYIEAYYRYWANQNLSISPDVQYIINPGGDGEKDNVFVYGIRMQATF